MASATLPLGTGPTSSGAGSLAPNIPKGASSGSVGGHKLPNADSGWYVFLGVMAGVVTANSKAGPYVFGILGVALLYQVGQLLRGNYTYS